MTGLVEPLVAPVLPAAAGTSAARAQDQGQGYDFAIGGLQFNIASDDNNPYQRATAQFKKDQLDTTPTPGDQSLTGYWTRGQYTFHHGAGITYYEVDLATSAWTINSDTVINRYNDGQALCPFDAGKVTLYPAWRAATPDTYASITRALAVGDDLAVLSGGTITCGPLDTPGTVYQAGSDSYVGMTVGGGDIFGATSAKSIVRIGLGETVVEVASEGFESGTNGWDTSTALGNYTLATAVATDTTKAYEGTTSLKTTWPDQGTTQGSWVGKNFTGLVSGRAYTMVAKVFVPTGSGTVKPQALFTATGSAVTTLDAWTTVAFTFTATDTHHYIGFLNSACVSGTNLWVDKFELYEGTYTDYATSGSVPVDTIYTHSKAITDLFYAKDRVFMVDASNTWYQLSPKPTGTLPVAIPDTSRLFTVGGSGDWVVTDTPGPVLFGTGNRVFAVFSDNSGAMPTLSGPVQVADLPNTETIRGLAYMLGFVVIVTSLGIRVAILSDSGKVNYGPNLTDFTSAPRYTTIGRLGSTAWVCGDHDVYVIDLAQQVGNQNDLTYAFAKAPNPFAAEANYGATAIGSSVVVWGDDKLLVQDTKLATGWLTTGYHRYGTLEPKQFRSVKVRVGGDGGTVAVSRVMADGSSKSLYTYDVSRSDGGTITLGLSETEEMLGLRFDLAPSASDQTKGPVLLGYQLYALPAPTRQRMIQVPLLCYDVEGRQPARRTGHRGGAWEKLAALEDMERSGGTFFFQDFRTGEAGECYIEAVEFKGTTPPTAASTGFGGLLQLTLRKL